MHTNLLTHLEVAKAELLQQRNRPAMGGGVVPSDGGVVHGCHHSTRQAKVDEVLGNRGRGGGGDGGCCRSEDGTRGLKNIAALVRVTYYGGWGEEVVHCYRVLFRSILIIFLLLQWPVFFCTILYTIIFVVVTKESVFDFCLTEKYILKTKEKIVQRGVLYIHIISTSGKTSCHVTTGPSRGLE